MSKIYYYDTDTKVKRVNLVTTLALHWKCNIIPCFVTIPQSLISGSKRKFDKEMVQPDGTKVWSGEQDLSNGRQTRAGRMEDQGKGRSK